MATKPDTSTLVSQHASTIASSTSPSANNATESIFSRIFMGPLLFISFMISLCLVDQKTSDRVFAHDGARSESSAPLTSETPDAQFTHYYKSNGKKLARRDMEDAFQMRKKVMVGLLVLAGAVLFATCWVLRKAIGLCLR